MYSPTRKIRSSSSTRISGVKFCVRAIADHGRSVSSRCRSAIRYGRDITANLILVSAIASQHNKLRYVCMANDYRAAVRHALAGRIFRLSVGWLAFMAHAVRSNISHICVRLRKHTHAYTQLALEFQIPTVVTGRSHPFHRLGNRSYCCVLAIAFANYTVFVGH